MTSIRFGIVRQGFVAKDGKLFYEPGGVESKVPPMPLLYQGQGKFVNAEDVEFTFQFSQERPRAKHLDFDWYGGKFTTVRVEEAKAGRQEKEVK